MARLKYKSGDTWVTTAQPVRTGGNVLYHNLTRNLTHVTLDEGGADYSLGIPDNTLYDAYINADSGYTISTIQVLMGDMDITNDALVDYGYAKMISIYGVTDDITITVVAE